MNMNKALQHLYKAVSGNDTSKVNISKLLVDIHYAITGKESPVKKNWSKIIDSIATNWTGGGGGGSSDFSTCTMAIVRGGLQDHIVLSCPFIATAPTNPPFDYINAGNYKCRSGGYSVVLYLGSAVMFDVNGEIASTSGDIESLGDDAYLITGDCTIEIY